MWIKWTFKWSNNNKYYNIQSLSVCRNGFNAHEKIIILRDFMQWSSNTNNIRIHYTNNFEYLQNKTWGKVTNNTQAASLDRFGYLNIIFFLFSYFSSLCTHIVDRHHKYFFLLLSFIAFFLSTLSLLLFIE